MKELGKTGPGAGLAMPHLVKTASRCPELPAIRKYHEPLFGENGFLQKVQTPFLFPWRN